MEKYTQQAEVKDLYSLSKSGREWCKTLKWGSGIQTWSSKYAYDSRPTASKYLVKKPKKKSTLGQRETFCSVHINAAVVFPPNCMKHEENH